MIFKLRAIPERSSFYAIMGQAIDKYTEDDWDHIDFLTFSSVGWNTGVGLFTFGSDKLEQMNIFHGIIRTLRIGNKRFEWNSELKLLFFIKKLNGFKAELTMAETIFYLEDHPTRKGCKIVACKADQLFLDELYKYPKDHAFSIRFGGNLSIRGGERIDPDDPDAVRQRRPKLTRTAAKKFIQGSGEDILNNGQRVDDEDARKAGAEHMRKHVTKQELFTHSFVISTAKQAMIFLRQYRARQLVKKLIATMIYYNRVSKYSRYGSFNKMVVKSKVERTLLQRTAQIIERNNERIWRKTM